MPRLTDEQVASIPGLLRSLGTYRAVAKELGVTHQAIRKRAGATGGKPVPRKLPAVAALAASPPPDITEANGDADRRNAKVLLMKSAKKALDEDDVVLMVTVARGIIALANSKDQARKAAVTLIDARSVHFSLDNPDGKALVAFLVAAEERWPGALELAKRMLPGVVPAAEGAGRT